MKALITGMVSLIWQQRIGDYPIELLENCG